MKKLIDIVKRDDISVSKEMNLLDTIELLYRNKEGCVVIVDNSVVMGILTERDVLSLLNNDICMHQSVLNVVKKSVVTININRTIEDAIHILIDNNIRHLVVQDNEVFIGIVTERDVLYHISRDRAVKTSIVKNIRDIIDIKHTKSIAKAVINDVHGNVIGIIGNKDIIKNIKSNYEVSENRLKYTEETLSNMDEVILELDNNNGTILIRWGNGVALRQYGKKIINKKITDLIDENIWSKVMSLLEKDGRINEYKISIRGKEYMLSFNRRNNDNIKKSFFIICKDITTYKQKLLALDRNLDIHIKEKIEKNKQYQKDKFQKDKLIQMSEMISMIAHQWRQPLNAISASSINLSLLSNMNMLNDSKLQESSKFIQNQCQKMSKTIDTFMNFVKPANKPTEFKISHAIDSVVLIMGTQLKNYNIALNIDIDDENILLIGDESQLKQVIISILSNSKDAFEEIEIENKSINISVKTKEGIPTITIEDNAGGIPQDIREKIFNPYFTTKEQGKGTGIGLCLSMGIMRKSFGGDLVYSATEGGSSFRIVL